MSEVSEYTLHQKYWGAFVGVCCIVIVLQLVARNGTPSQKGVTLAANPKFKNFQRTYLMIFLFAMFADWLQGPYVYELVSFSDTPSCITLLTLLMMFIYM